MAETDLDQMSRSGGKVLLNVPRSMQIYLGTITVYMHVQGTARH